MAPSPQQYKTELPFSSSYGMDGMHNLLFSLIEIALIYILHKLAHFCPPHFLLKCLSVIFMQFWPVVGWVNYQYIPLQLRVIFHSLVACFWY